MAELQLERNAATLLLRNELDLESDSDDDGQPPPPTRVTLGGSRPRPCLTGVCAVWGPRAGPGL